MNKLRELFINNVLSEMERQDLDGKGLAARMKMAPSQLSVLLSGSQSTTIDTLERFSEALAVPASSLLAPEIAANSSASTRASSVQLADIAAGDEGTTPNKPQPGKDALLGQVVARLPALDESQLKDLLRIVRALPLTQTSPGLESSKERKQ